MYFSLRTSNDFQKEQVGKVVDLLKATFGEENITTRDYEFFTTVATRNISGLVDFTTTHSLMLFDDIGENAKKVKVDIDLLDVVYDLDR